MIKYLCELRPPGYAQIPDGYKEYEAWCPPRVIPKIGRWSWHGFVVYDEPLTPDQKHRWGLHEWLEAENAIR